MEQCADNHVVRKHDNTIAAYDKVFIANDNDGTLKQEETDKYDNTTHVTYSVMVYHTPEFKKITPDVLGYIDTILATTNLGKLA